MLEKEKNNIKINKRKELIFYCCFKHIFYSTAKLRLLGTANFTKANARAWGEGGGGGVIN